METRRFILLLFVSHLILFYSIFDVYFTSPVHHGMSVHRSTRTPRAKRVVLFVADGLRADKFFENHLNKTPHLKSIVEKRTSLSGISHTRVPTESRPGHVAIISGFYEDVSAVTRGWKENPVEFDSVFNRSRFTFGFGSPDIVPMFKRGQSYEHFYMECYDATKEEFGNDRAHELDLWVEQQFEKFLRNEKFHKELNDDKIVFFFHLLGIDTNGHSHKPWSNAYMKNIQIVDGIVQRMEKLIENFYKNDGQTTFLFTSDHGMTDSGSHGAGDDTETLTPIVVWGSAIRSSVHQDVHLEQADLCPLMAFFLGLDYPVNSVGQLPVKYFLPIDEDLLQAYLQNAHQLLEEVHQQHDQLKKRLLFFKPFPLNEEAFFHRMQTMEGFVNVYQIKEHIADFIVEIQKARHYYHTYRRFLLSILIVTGFVVSLGTIFQQLNSNPQKTSSHRFGWIFKLVSLLVFVLFVVEQSPWTHLLYPLLVSIHTWISIDFILNSFDRRRFSSLKIVPFLIVFLQTYILPFFARWTMSIGVLFLFLDAFRRWNGSFFYDRRRLAYGLCLLIISIFPCLPSLGTMKTTLFICTFLSGSLTFIVYLLYFHGVKRERFLRRFQLFSLILALTMNFLVHQLLIRSSSINFLSWFILVSSALLPLFSSNQIRFERLLTIFTSILTIYILLSTQYESLFVFVLCALMLFWVRTTDEQQQQTLDISLISCQSLFFILLAFFGTGNFASVNSFDPTVVYCFLTIFNPFLMSAMILLKCILPILVVNCATASIIRTTQLNRTFRLYTLILCDILALELFFAIRTEGSWLQIGESISRYVILMAMIVILMAFQYLAGLLLTTQWTFVSFLSFQWISFRNKIRP